MIPVTLPSNAVTTAIRQSLPMMPGKAADVIVDYAGSVDYEELAQIGIILDDDGHVTNPVIRNAFKEGLVSYGCSGKDKTALMRSIFYSTYFPSIDSGFSQAEFEKIFNEIAASGYKVVLDGADLSDMAFRHLNWTGGSLRNVNLSATVLFDIAMSDADLTGATLDDGHWTDIDLANAMVSEPALNRLTVRENVVW